MSVIPQPRLLIVDDDLGVIAAYRLVLEKAPDSRTVQTLFGLEALEMELFGAPELQEVPQEWRIKFLDQGADAVQEVQWAMNDGDPFTAIFLDVRMPPGINGYDAAQQIRNIDPNVHLVIVSGYNDFSYEDFVEVAGPASKVTYMPKPVWPDQLRKVARMLTGTRRVA